MRTGIQPSLDFIDGLYYVLPRVPSYYGEYLKSERMKSWLKFLAGLFFIWLFIWHLVPLLNNIQTYAKMDEFIREREIDAGTLFYTESKEAGEAAFYMNKTKQR